MSNQPAPSNDSSVIPELREYEDRRLTLKQQIVSAEKCAEQLVQAKAEYEPLEQAIKRAKKEAAKAASALEHLQQPLGKAAFDALVTGQIVEQPAFSERMKLNAAIAELRREHDAIIPPPDAGMLDKAKAKARQLAIVGKIKLEELKTGGLDTQIGKQLVDSGREESVQCSGTELVLGQVASARGAVAQTQQQVKRVTAILESKNAAIREAFGLPRLEGTRTLGAEVKRCRRSVREMKEQLSLLEFRLSMLKQESETRAKAMRTAPSPSGLGPDYTDTTSIGCLRAIGWIYLILAVLAAIIILFNAKKTVPGAYLSSIDVRLSDREEIDPFAIGMAIGIALQGVTCAVLFSVISSLAENVITIRKQISNRKGEGGPPLGNVASQPPPDEPPTGGSFGTEASLT